MRVGESDVSKFQQSGLLQLGDFRVKCVIFLNPIDNLIELITGELIHDGRLGGGVGVHNINRDRYEEVRDLGDKVSSWSRVANMCHHC